jgi:hypothetical protein
MDFLNKLGIVSLLLTLVSLYLVGEKVPIGWLIFIISYSIQVFIFVKTKQFFLIVQMGILSLFSVYNFIKWSGGI